MPRSSLLSRLTAITILGLLPALDQDSSAQQPPGAEQSTEQQSSPADTDSEHGEPAYRTESIRGQIVWLADALQSQFGISTVPEARERGLAILTPQGRIVPLVENLRGRAFRKDERLRGKDMELLVRRYERHPLAQVLRIYQWEDGQRYKVDYWCDVCAIVMFEKGPCSCCQDPNRLRKQLVEDEDPDDEG